MKKYSIRHSSSTSHSRSALSSANGFFSLGFIIAILVVLHAQMEVKSKPDVRKLLLEYMLSRPDQVTVTSMTFPASGDRLSYAEITNPGISNIITPPGGGQNWNISQLKASKTFETVYRPASEGTNFSSFNGANLVSKDSLGESYYKTSASTFEFLGQTGGELATLGVKAIYKFTPPVTERRSPVNFFDIKQQSSNVNSLHFAIKDLPASLVANFAGINTADSIRMRINYQVLEVFDAWGNLTIPGSLPQSQYQVLRGKYTIYTTTAMDVHTSLGWIDIFPFGSGDGLLALIGTDTLVKYRFFNNKEKEEIAVVELNNNQSEVISVRYKNNSSTTPLLNKNSREGFSIKAYPNPATEWVQFDCSPLPSGVYRLKIFNIAGIEIINNTYTFKETKSIRLNLGNLKAGTYIYRLEDENKTYVEIRRLVMVK
ncbi:MAG: T9SS type A sorting domain-containing protein [Saprospiraceae bacterium]